MVLCHERLAQRRPDFPAHGVVSRHGFVRTLENDDVALAGQRPDDGGLREGPEDVQVNRTNFGVAPLPQIVNGRLDIFSRRAERHKYRVRVLRLIFSDQAIVAAGQFSEIFVGLFQELQNRLREIIAARHDALHVVFLILHGTEEHGVRQVDHARHAPALRAKQNALAFGRTIDHVVRRAQIFAHQFRLVLVEGALQVRGEESVLHVHSRSQAEFGHAPQNERLVGRLLRVFAEQNDPAGIERAVHVVVSAVDVQRVLGERASPDLQNHRRALARRVVILLHAVDDSLARRKIDDPLAADGVRDGSALRGVLAFRLDGDGVMAEDIQFAFRVSLLVQLAALGGRGDRVENSRVGDASFGVIRNQLISVGCYADTGVPGFFPHVALLGRGHADVPPQNFRHSAKA